MATMVARIHDALRDAGASAAKARKATEIVAANADSESIGERRDAPERRLTRLEGEMDLQRWRLGTVGAPNIAILVNPFVP